MHEVNVKEARRPISRLLDEVCAGQEVVIFRRGKPVARLTRIDENETGSLQFPDHSELRRKLPSMGQSSASLIRRMRRERG